MPRPPQQRRERPREQRRKARRVAAYRTRDLVRRDAAQDVQRDTGSKRRVTPRKCQQGGGADHRDRPERREREGLAAALGKGDSEHEDRDQRRQHDSAPSHASGPKRPRASASNTAAVAVAAIAAASCGVSSADAAGNNTL